MAYSGSHKRTTAQEAQSLKGEKPTRLLTSYACTQGAVLPAQEGNPVDRQSSTGARCFMVFLLAAPWPSGHVLDALIGNLSFICILLVAEHHLLLHWHGAYRLSLDAGEPVAARKVDHLYSRWEGCL